MAEFGGEHAQGDGQVGFADAGRAQQDDVAALMKKAAGGELVEEPFIERGLLGEIETGEALLIGQVGELEVKANGFVVPAAEFALEQVAEEMGITPAGGGGLLGRLVELLPSDGEAELLQAAHGKLLHHEAHWQASW
jgi:hypothetical protein